MINPSFLSLPANLLVQGLRWPCLFVISTVWYHHFLKIFCLVSACFRPMLTLGIELGFSQNIRNYIFTFRFLMALVNKLQFLVTVIWIIIKETQTWHSWNISWTVEQKSKNSGMIIWLLRAREMISILGSMILNRVRPLNCYWAK